MENSILQQQTREPSATSISINNTISNRKLPVELKLAQTTRQQGDENFPVLKIEEDLDLGGIDVVESKSISTQTSPVHDVTNKKGSTSTIWTSEESILRSAGTVDEDNKSTSSSACEETGGVLSSAKSGKLNSN